MPLISDVRIDMILTNLSVQAKNPGFIAEELSPILPVTLETSRYFVYDFSRFDAPQALRAERAQYGRIDMKLSTDVYVCNEYGLEIPIDDRERQNAIDPINVDVDATELVTDTLLGDREKRVAAMFTTEGNYTHSNFTNYAAQPTAWLPTNGASDPISDVAITGREAIRANIGLYPNTFWCGAKVFSNLRQHPSIIDRIKFNGSNANGAVPGRVAIEAVAQLFEVDRVVIGLPLVRTSNENQTDTLADVWGNHAGLAFINPRPAPKQVTFAYMFQARPRQVFKYREDKISSDIIRCSEITAEKIVSDRCGYFFENVLG